MAEEKKIRSEFLSFFLSVELREDGHYHDKRRISFRWLRKSVFRSCFPTTWSRDYLWFSWLLSNISWWTIPRISHHTISMIFGWIHLSVVSLFPRLIHWQRCVMIRLRINFSSPVTRLSKKSTRQYCVKKRHTRNYRIILIVWSWHQFYMFILRYNAFLREGKLMMKYSYFQYFIFIIYSLNRIFHSFQPDINTGAWYEYVDKSNSNDNIKQ